MIQWKDLSFNPINLWNVPKNTIEKDILDRIEDEVFRYYTKFQGRMPSCVYLGQQEVAELDAIQKGSLNLRIVWVSKESYLKVGV